MGDVMDKPKGKQNWEILKDNRKFLDKYLNILAQDPKEVPDSTDEIRAFYDSMSIEEMIGFDILIGSLEDLFGRECGFIEGILAGQNKWEVKK